MIWSPDKFSKHCKNIKVLLRKQYFFNNFRVRVKRRRSKENAHSLRHPLQTPKEESKTFSLGDERWRELHFPLILIKATCFLLHTPPPHASTLSPSLGTYLHRLPPSRSTLFLPLFLQVSSMAESPLLVAVRSCQTLLPGSF